MNLRDYQQEGLDALYSWWMKHQSTKDIPILEYPTGSGKSLICAELVRLLFDTWPQDHPRTIVIVPSKELAEQNAEKLKLVLPPHLSVGFYSASIGKKQPDADVIVATIGSVHKAAHIVGSIKTVIVDECHLIRPDGAGMYRTFINDLARYCTFRVVGMTATPFRGNGVWLTDGKDPLFTGIAYRCDIKRLLNEGYLAPLVTPAMVTTRIDTSGIKLVNGDFHIDQLAERVEHYIDGGAIEAMQLAHDRKKWIAFTPTVANAYHLERSLNDLGARSAVVCGETPKKERERLIAEFRRGEIRCLVTVLALATGFDVPDVDCILWYRPTRSPVLYVQGAGRGLRIAPGKKDCLWLDFSDTTDRLGPIDAIKGRAAKKEGNAEAPFAVCDECGAIVRPASLLHCPECGTQMREIEEPTHKGASNAFVLTPIEPIWRSVDRVTYSRWSGKDGKPDTMRVDYWKGMSRIASEFICVFHPIGWAREKANRWCRQRDLTIEETLYYLLQDGNDTVKLKYSPTAILLDMCEKYPRIIDYRFEDETVTL